MTNPQAAVHPPSAASSATSSTAATAAATITPPPTKKKAHTTNLSLYDAHCHPTDTMRTSAAAIPTMRTRVLTVMATRAQDQELVVQLAEMYGGKGEGLLPDDERRGRSQRETGETEARDENRNRNGNEDERMQRIGKVIPALGWHPWYSHLLYDDVGMGMPSSSSSSSNNNDNNEKEDTNPATASASIDKGAHYRAVLTPSPSEDDASAAAFLASLPQPRPLSAHLTATAERLARFPTALVGEVGLDRSFRLPNPEYASPSPQEDQDSDASFSSPSLEAHAHHSEYLTPGRRPPGHPLSPYRVHTVHQRAILAAQLSLAGRQGRAASVHSVGAHGVVLDLLAELWRGHERVGVNSRRKEKHKKRQEREATIEAGVEASEREAERKGGKTEEPDEHQGGQKQQQQLLPALPYPPRLCLHSYSGPPEQVRRWVHPAVPCDVFFSFSTAINFSRLHDAAKVEAVIRAVPADRLLIESDLHRADDEMDTRMADIADIVCRIRDWELSEGVRILERNYMRFVFG